MKVKVNRPAGARAAQPLVPLPLRVLNRAFDEIDADHDPIDDYAEVAQRVRQEESAW